jgi:hypothetical protein
MFVNEFVFSFSLLAFMGLLLLGSTVLLLDAFRRIFIDAYKGIATSMVSSSRCNRSDRVQGRDHIQGSGLTQAR